MKQQLTSLLRTADLKEEEVKTYLVLLKLQQATITQLTEKTGFHRIMVYRTLKRLNDRGLIEEAKLNNRQNIYKPLSLESLIKNIHREQQKLAKLQNSLRNLDSLLPYIDLEDESEEMQIEIMEGLENFKREYLKFPELCSDEYLHVGSMDNLWETAGISADSAEERNFIRKRMSKGIFARVLNPYSEVMEDIQSRDSLEKRTMKIKQKLPIMDNYLAISENQSTLFINDKENPRAIVIKQPDLLEMQKQQFSALWNQNLISKNE